VAQALGDAARRGDDIHVIHGDNSSGQYYFIPSDFDKARLESTSVLFTYIKDAVASIPGKVVVFMDTCHAGDVLGTAGTKAIPPSIDGMSTSS
jgi:uncharacterized caspase-like protein